MVFADLSYFSNVDLNSMIYKYSIHLIHLITSINFNDNNSTFFLIKYV